MMAINKRSIIKGLFAIIAVCMIFLAIPGCASNTQETEKTDSGWYQPRYTYAMIVLPDGTIVEGELEHWYYPSTHSVTMSVTIDGKQYLVSVNNLVLMEASK